MDAPRSLGHVFIKVEDLEYKRDPRFTGRDWEILFLNLWLSTSPGRSCVVGGMPGIGKTQLVNEYVHRFSESYDCMIWLPSGHLDAMMAAMRHFCHKLGIATMTSDLEECAKLFKSWLSTSRNWLLIFDDVLDWTTIEKFLPEAHGSSLITTRDLSIIPGETHNLQLDSLDPTSGAELLSVYLNRQNETISTDDQALARAVSEELGGLPMALAHIAGYMKKHELSLQTMVERLRTPGLCDPIWREKFSLSTLPHPLALGEVWDSTMAELRPEGRAILELLGFFDADQVPQYFWGSRIQDEPQRVVFRRARDELQRRGLVQRKRIDGVTHFSVHRALQKDMLYRLGWGTRRYSCALENAIAMVDGACPRREPFEVPDQDLWPKYHRVLIQAESLRVRIADDRLPRMVALQLCHVYAEVSRYLHLRGDPGRAQPLLEAGLHMCEAMPESSAGVATAQSTLLLLWVENQNALGPPKRTSTIAACHRAVVLRKKEKEHPAPAQDAKMDDDLWLSDALQSLGRAFLETSDWRNAETRLTESLSLLEKHQARPYELPYSFAAAYETLALVRMSQDRPGDALDLIDLAINIVGLAQRPSDAVLVQLRLDRAVILFNRGSFKEAWKAAKESLRNGEALLGAVSSSGLTSLFWVSYAAYCQRLFREAERNLRELLRKSAAAGIQQWPRECTARAQYLLAETLEALGEELEEAMQWKQEAAKTIGQDGEDSVSMADFDVRISIYYGRSMGIEE